MRDDRIHAALVDLLVTQVRQTSVSSAALVTLVGVVVWETAPLRQVQAWMLVGYLTSLPRLFVFGWISRRLSASGVGSGRGHVWLERAIVLALFLSGLHWGTAAWLFLDPTDAYNFAFVATILLGVVSAALASYSIRPLVWLVFSTTVYGLVVAKLITLESWGLAVMTTLFFVHSLLVLSRGLGARTEKSITQELLNAELLEDVRRAKEAAEKASLEKSLFMTATSHDLRQPLHAQSLLLAILAGRLQGTELAELVDKMVQSNDALNMLFDSLLEVSQLDAGTISVHASDQSLARICHLVADEFREVAGRKGLYIELVGDDLAVHSDPVLLTRILRNLVSNAIKFTVSGGVTLTIARAGAGVRLSVRDTGIGIPEGEQETIFDEYVQLGNKARDRSKGIGLGLALVRRMCDLLGLEVGVESRPGSGACFHLHLPCGDVSRVARPGAETAIEVARDLDVLVIDDERMILDAMREMLADWSCRAHTFTTFREAALAIESGGLVPDLIISDYRLNEPITGVEAIARTRRLLGGAASVPAILISGDTDPKLLEQVEGQDFYLLHKPLKVSRLRKVVSVLLGRHVGPIDS